MKIVESFMTRNPCYKTNRKIAVRGVALYSVGCPQPSAKVFVNNWNNEKYSKACAHAFVDANDGLVYQTLPWNHRGWHGNADRNNSMIGIMLCEPHQIKYFGADTFNVVGEKADAIRAAERVYQSTVELCGQICVKYNFDPMTAIWAPEGGSSDPEHLWKGLGLDYTMHKLRLDVAEEIKRICGIEDDREVLEEPIMASASSVQQPAVIEEAPLMRVRVVYDNLRIRSGPGTDCATTGSYTGRGIFNIVEIQNGNGSKSGWGKLSDGSGWISLDFAEKL